MSEYSDYYAIRVANPATLVPALNAAGIEAIVYDTLVFTEARPVWVAVAFGCDEESALLLVGPAIHIRLDEDQKSWQLAVITLSGTITYSFFHRPFWYRDENGEDLPPYGFRPVAPRPMAAADAQLLSETFGVSPEQLFPSLRFGGFGAFTDATGVPYLEMLDTSMMQLDTKPLGRGVAVSERGMPD